MSGGRWSSSEQRSILNENFGEPVAAANGLVCHADCGAAGTPAGGTSQVLSVRHKMKKNPPSAKAPPAIGKFDVLCYSMIDARHHPTKKTRHYVGGSLEESMAGLAIARYPEDREFYLLYCDQDWKPVTDTCHATIEEAKHQAEFEYAGVSKTWIEVGKSK